MKKLIIIFLFFTGSLFAQGTLNTPYDTTGWDPPATYTQWYGLRIFTLLSNPGGGYNRNTRDIDSLMYELVVYTDTNQLAISNDTLVFANSMSGISTFSTTDQYDTVLISGFFLQMLWWFRLGKPCLVRMIF